MCCWYFPCQGGICFTWWRCQKFCDSPKLLIWTSHKLSGMKKAYSDVSPPKAEDNKDVLNYFWKYYFQVLTDEGTKVIPGARCLMAWNESYPKRLNSRCVGGGRPKDTSGVRISSRKITESYTLEEICSQTPAQSRSSQMRLFRATSCLVWVSPRTVQLLENLWWCLISYMVKNHTIKILLDLFSPFECFSSDCNPIFCLACFICLSLLITWKLP